MGQKRPISFNSKQTGDYLLTASYATVPGLSVIIEEDGYYDVTCTVSFYAAANGDDCLVQLTNGDGDIIYGSQVYCRNGLASGISYCPITLNKLALNFKRGDSVEIRAKYSSTAGGILNIEASNYAELQVVKRN